MTFSDCVRECAGCESFVREFDRLAGTHLSTMGRRAPPEQMIDQATGRDEAAARRFVGFVWDCVWVPLVGDPGDAPPVA